jgi:recombination protein RecT
MSGPATAGNGQIVKVEKAGDNLVRLLGRMQGEIARALPRQVTAERMARVVTTAMRMNPKLAQSDETSFIGCVLALAQLGLEPNTPMQQAWLIPRKATKRRDGGIETTIMIGYQGYITLAHRSGLVSAIESRVVFGDDAFDYQYGTDPRILHKPHENEDRTDARKVTHAYAVGHMLHGRPVFEVLTRAQIEKRRTRSASGDRTDSPWHTDWIAMARKTAIRALWPQLPKSAEMVMASALDEAHDLGKPVTTAIVDGPAAEVLDAMGVELGSSEDNDVTEEPR